ncbi:hypothetical protein NDI85_19780 [Halomicroarcula sp. S1AR25-4]|uniref:hypothetical protein n=1 Tax=Haloarcula sp. S1AR25-4 TaxID=2950538 RepID=UPI0028741B49|nr:hypothetical protein [Halomicroarcula sp. S1AR25-4]MDS0280029.1 hypothetical protein [Halomicroarcula sp. S1AR25-4]
MTTLLETGTRLCPVCGEQKDRLSRHWSYCEWPEIGDAMHDLLGGILLGGGTIQGNGDAKHLLVLTTNEELARWLFDELDWLAHSLRRETFDGERNPQYRVRTHAHDTLRRYRDRWYADGEKRLRDDVDLSADSARVWYALAGGIEWTGDYDSQFRVIFSAEADDRAAAIQSVLDRHGYDSERLDRRVVMYGDAARDWLDWTAPPAPGVEYKWQTDKPVYTALRTDPDDETEYKTELYTAALSVARERTDSILTPGRFEARVDGLDAGDVADWLGGGSWDDALSTAGVPKIPYDTASKPVTERDAPEYSYDDATEAVQQAAGAMGEPLTAAAYDEWRETETGVPSSVTIQQNFGWSALLLDAGVQPGRVVGHSLDSLTNAVLRMHRDHGEWPTSAEYREWSTSTDPSLQWFYEQEFDDIDSWSDLIEHAKAQL